MDFSSLNWLAVLVCVVASMLRGPIWFSPKVFCPGWWKAIGEPKADDVMQPAPVWGGTILASLIQAVLIHYVILKTIPSLVVRSGKSACHVPGHGRDF